MMQPRPRLADEEAKGEGVKELEVGWPWKAAKRDAS